MRDFVLIIFLFTSISLAQATGIIEGEVKDLLTGEPLVGANIIILDTNIGGATDSEGKFLISGVLPGVYSVKASLIGYGSIVKTDITVNTARPYYIEFELRESVIELENVVVTSDYFDKDPTETVSVKTFSYEEIRRAPGGFEDVVRALSVLPGVALQSAGRNDLIVRGGAPSENLFIVDGFIVPNINHFGSQGATGGPLSFINLDYVNETTFSTGGFSAAFGDKLSSVLTIDLRDARKDRIGGKAQISASQFGLNLEGPFTDNSSFIFSLRRSYLDFIFNAAGFNFVPTYYDILTKFDFNLENNNKLTFLFTGALDRVTFNNETEEDIYDNSTILGSDQNQYVAGISYRHLFGDGFFDLTFSRNYVDYDYQQNDTLQQPIFKNKSYEAENELKGTIVYKLDKNTEFNAGISGKLIDFQADVVFPKGYTTTFGELLPINSLSDDKFYYKAGGYLQLSKLINKFRFNVGGRLDYFDAIENSIAFSPRFSASYSLTDVTSVNISTGIYKQSPSYIWISGYPANNQLEFITVNQYIAGFDHLLNSDLRIKLEFFYKDYKDYPTSTLRPYLVLANTGAGFGGTTNFDSFGFEELVSKAEGFARGIELSLQKKSSGTPYYGLMSLTFSESEYKGLDNVYRTGKYDQTWLFNVSGGYIINENWEFALKFRFATGNPYTPYNNDGTQSVSNYLTERFDNLHSLDLRVDRKWFFENFTLITYIDIQNIYNNKTTNSIRWNYYKNEVDDESSIGLLPSIGVNIEF